MSRIRLYALLLLFLTGISSSAEAQKIEVPRRHDRPPGPPLSAEEAVKKMTVPVGFSVEIVAAEPDIMNPVAMFIDEQGRFWVTESFEYPRREPGPGRDRIKVLEDTDGDGKVDKVTIFAEGLNIPSGIAVGHGGVWVANSPDILFLQDTDGDLKADKQEIVVTGFGRDDTHELPNSLTWGPDGWLYGLNGVFNYCNVSYAATNPNFSPDHPGWKFTAAMFRIHPRTREFQVFAEGTSNPWGIAFNGDGEAFISACVIDHLWHLTETGYYIRQGGPYPPHTWPLRSIVNHHHQKAAYCGITWFDSDAYPEEYRNVLYMGNIHGGCINADIVVRQGSSYQGTPHPGFPGKPGAWAADEFGTLRKEGTPEQTVLKDLLTANDAWFMPVVQKVGPDGCLYILDWYDRYHCYQDANADPEGIEREKGRLYRLVYQGHQNRKAENIGDKSSEQLVEMLGDRNVYRRETAQRLLQERSQAAVTQELKTIVTTESGILNQGQRHALWTLIGSQLERDGADAHAEELSNILAAHADPFARAWGMRLHTSQRMRVLQWSDPFELHAAEQARAALESSDATVRLQGVIFVTRLLQQQAPPVPFSDDLANALALSVDDPVLTNTIWNSCLALVERSPEDVDELLHALISTPGIVGSSGGSEVVRRLIDLAVNLGRYQEIAAVIIGTMNQQGEELNPARQALLVLTERIQSGEVGAVEVAHLRGTLEAALTPVLTLPEHPLHFEVVLLALSSRWPGPATDPQPVSAAAIRSGRLTAVDLSAAEDRRIRATQALIASGDQCRFEVCGNILAQPESSANLKGQVLAALSRVDENSVGGMVLRRYPSLSPDLQLKAIELLTQRGNWSSQLLKAVEAKEIPNETLNLNQLRRIASFKDETLQEQFKAIYGTIREGRNPNREQVFNQMRDFLGGTPGDPLQGEVVFKKVCAQCHKMYQEGAEVGPDITRNGRSNWEQLLQNVLDPSAVIGPGYQARMLATTDGRVLTGLPVEESDQRVILKIQGGKLETIPRDQIEEYKVSELSMMPEDLEKQLTPQQLADLFSFLALDRHPNDPEAKVLSGAPAQQRR